MLRGMKKSIRLDLALQGGGAHGAFTWRGLDRLLDETDTQISRISATSAGAVSIAPETTELKAPYVVAHFGLPTVAKTPGRWRLNFCGPR